MTNDTPNLNDAVASVLRAELAALDWTLEELANASGVPRVSVQRYLKGSRRLNIETLGILAQALDTDAAAIMSAAVDRLSKPTPPRPPVQTSTKSIPKTG